MAGEKCRLGDVKRSDLWGCDAQRWMCTQPISHSLAAEAHCPRCSPYTTALLNHSRLSVRPPDTRGLSRSPANRTGRCPARCPRAGPVSRSHIETIARRWWAPTIRVEPRRAAKSGISRFVHACHDNYSTAHRRMTVTMVKTCLRFPPVNYDNVLIIVRGWLPARPLLSSWFGSAMPVPI